MAILRVQHSFQHKSGKAEDQFVNVFHFIGEVGDGASLQALVTAVQGFYFTAPTGGASQVKTGLSSTMDANGAKLKVYDLADVIPRSPIHQYIYDPGAFTEVGQNLPPEVACCLSYAADPAPGIPIASRRGRIYIGPLNSSIMQDTGASSDTRPKDTWRQDIVLAAGDMASIALALGYTWAVYSPTRATAAPITRMWVDDAWDTQRRRGLDSTSRISGTI